VEPEFVDSHCHLDFPDFDSDRGAVLQRAVQAGVRRVVLIGCHPDRERREGAAQLARTTPGVSLVSGVHPHEAARADTTWADHVCSLAREGLLVGVGEIGLDYHYDTSPRVVQLELFAGALRLARQLELPVVIHTREAEADTLEVLDSVGLPAAGGVIHCFSGTERLAFAALDRGLHLGLTGMITLGWADDLRSLLPRLPLDRLLLETDSPYLGPAPKRPRRNEPCFVPAIAARLAAELGVSVAEVARHTTEAAQRLFRLPPTTLRAAALGL
jgi:TatD DNase family protein